MSLDGEAFLKKYGAQAASDAPPIARIREMGIPSPAAPTATARPATTPGSGCTGW